MGGQACVFYGAAEFSRDCDIVVVTDDENLKKLESALSELQANCIAMPPMDWRYLDKGHAIHFRCSHPEADGIRLDVMTKMRGCGDFDTLWENRTTLKETDGIEFELLGIEDLVRAKKTQREKDWPMIQRLVEAHYAEYRDDSNAERVRFWLRESRTPETLKNVAENYPSVRDEVLTMRPFLVDSVLTDRNELQKYLDAERQSEMEADRQYWQPLIKELEQLRLTRRRH